MIKPVCNPLLKRIMAPCLASALLAGCQLTPQSREAEHPMTNVPDSARAVIKALNLEGHVEGGFYRRTFQADDRGPIMTRHGERYTMTSIFYLLTAKSPIGHFHLNRSDIVHYYHMGDPIEYTLIYPDGSLETLVMGPDVVNGQRLQMTVKGGVWKASRVLPGRMGYGLISEAVSPGFDFADMTLGERQPLLSQFPQHAEAIRQLTRE
ncbi:cupin domain-containing protein [Marinimicrobium sp. ARAG 43.8]|uniref:cupin domain-containing protein n=1 Tax=Marinimicrobium sp. ARAG 43.8 TaxID=3418719 RepID=UPI003CEDF66B